MRNRAKCKLCEETIESKHQHDYVTCKCGEISLDGGNAYHHCRATDWNNLIYLDEEDNELIMKREEGGKLPAGEDKSINKITYLPPPREEMLRMLDEMYKRITELPMEATLAPVTHADMASLIMLLSSILKTF